MDVDRYVCDVVGRIELEDDSSVNVLRHRATTRQRVIQRGGRGHVRGGSS